MDDRFQDLLFAKQFLNTINIVKNIFYAICHFIVTEIIFSNTLINLKAKVKSLKTSCIWNTKIFSSSINE